MYRFISSLRIGSRPRIRDTPRHRIGLPRLEGLSMPARCAKSSKPHWHGFMPLIKLKSPEDLSPSALPATRDPPAGMWYSLTVTLVR